MNSLTTAYLIDIVGIEKFGNATGIINLFRGIGCLLGPFTAGFILDLNWSLDKSVTYKLEPAMAFYFCAVCYAFGFVFTLLASIWSAAYRSKGSQENGNVEMLKSAGSDIEKEFNESDCLRTVNA